MGKIRDWKNKLLVTLVYVIILIVLWSFRTPCILKTIAGIPCPGCGMSHAMFAVMRLDFAEAFSWHPMFWSMPVLYFYFLYDIKDMKYPLLHKTILILLGVGFLLNWVIKLFLLWR